jgi:hypothetical protein
MLGLPGFVLLAVSEFDGELEQAVETAAVEEFRRSCGVQAVPHGRRPVRVRDLPVAGRPVTLIWVKRVWRCVEPRCAKRTWSETSEHRPRASLTEGSAARTGPAAGKRLYPLVKELAADGVPVVVTCRVLKLARQPYYRWLARPVTVAELARAYRAAVLFDAHRDDLEFGYRFLLDEARDAGQPMAERTAWRICSANRWWSTFGKKRAKNGKKPGPPVHDDGQGRRGRRQRRHGELLRAAAEERPEPPELGHPRGAKDRDRHLDRTDLPPPPTPRRALGRLTPIEYETIVTTPATQAA